ncbi:MAG: Crp/Fnr family transcriptional regulator [Candidatus Binataceae bacterium]|jgi:CRP-like cAMP-binding protein
MSSLGDGEERLKQRLERCGLPREAIAALFSRYTVVRYPKGSPLLVKGSAADVILAVFSGIVKVYCAGWGATRVLVELAGPGDLAGYSNLADPAGGRPLKFEAEALTSASVALFTRDHLLRVLRELGAGTLLAVTETINSQWSSLVHRYAHYLVMSLRERLDDVLAEVGRRFGTRIDKGVLLLPELGQGALAEMIGGSRPMVSKLLAEMAIEGVIAHEGRHYILLDPRGAEEHSPASAGSSAHLIRAAPPANHAEDSAVMRPVAEE